MVKGKQGLYLEAWKFSVYLLVPIVASVYFSDPERQKKSADYWQFIKYPANPNINLKKQIEELAAKEKQREVYREQLKELGRQAQRTEIAAAQEKENAPKKGWLSWIGM